MVPLVEGVQTMMITVDLDIPISFVLDNGCGGLGDAVQAPTLDSLGLCVVDGPRGVEGFCVGGDETKVILGTDVV